MYLAPIWKKSNAIAYMLEDNLDYLSYEPPKKVEPVLARVEPFFFWHENKMSLEPAPAPTMLMQVFENRQ